MIEYNGYTIGDIINNKWKLIEIDKKFKSGRYRIIFTVKCINCGYIDENEVYFITKRKSCKQCKNNDLKSLIGLKQGRLEIIDLSPEKHSNGSTQYICKCDCGIIFTTTYSSIKRGTSSCGCLNREPTTLTHGMTGTRIYGIWKGMKARCYNPNVHNYKDYGGRGITVCDEWLYDFMNFYNWAIDNDYTDYLTLERLDPDGNYEPSNCIWADMLIQANNRRNTIYINYYDKMVTIRDLCNIYNENYDVLYHYYYNDRLFEYLRYKEGKVISDISRQLRNNN